MSSKNPQKGIERKYQRRITDRIVNDPFKCWSQNMQSTLSTSKPF